MMRSFFLILLLVGTAHGLLGTINSLINNFGGALQSAGNQIGQTATNLLNGAANHVNNIGGAIQSVGNQIGQTASNIFNGATNHANNVIGNVVDSAGHIYGQMVSTANGIQFASNFLWDNVFGPAFDMMVEGGQLFLDDKFGNIVSTIGRRRSILPENMLSEKYAELTARFKSNIHQLYDKLFQMEKEAFVALENGEKNLEDRVRGFYNQLNDIRKQITQLATETKNELEMHAVTVQGDWVQILHQYSQNIDFSAATMLIMFQQLAQDLMKNLLEAALGVVPNATAIIENMTQQGLLSFLKH